MYIEKIIKIKWRIIGIENYGFGSDNILYNTKRGTEKKQCYKDGSIGYWIGKKFYSTNQLRKMIYKPKKKDCPF